MKMNVKFSNEKQLLTNNFSWNSDRRFNHHGSMLIIRLRTVYINILKSFQRLTKSSYASLTAVIINTPTNGIAVVTGVNDEIVGINCKTKRMRK